MHVLIVHANPEPRSFNGALTRQAAETLTAGGHTVEVSDLHAMRFKATADADAYAVLEDADHLRIDRERTYLPGRNYDTGLLRGKLAMVSVTTGTSADTYTPDGIDSALRDVLWPVHNGCCAVTPTTCTT